MPLLFTNLVNIKEIRMMIYSICYATLNGKDHLVSVLSVSIGRGYLHEIRFWSSKTVFDSLLEFIYICLIQFKSLLETRVYHIFDII